MTDWIWLFLDIPREEWTGAVRFWAAATGWTCSAPRGEDGQFVTLEPAGGHSWLKLQQIDGPPRVHLDLDAADRDAAVAAAVRLGATPAWRYHDVEVMRSPGGFLFCHTVSQHPRRVDRTGDSVLDQVCLDIPPSRWEREVAFWAALTGRDLGRSRRPEFAFLGDPAAGLRILLQRLDSGDGPVTGHPDFAVADRARETRRHVDLGAQVVRAMDRWTVLRAPYGQPYCLTDREPATGSVRR